LGIVTFEVMVVTSLLSEKYDIYNIIKPGSSFYELNNSDKEDIGKLSHDDLIVIFCGSNNYELNKFSMVMRNISNFLQSNKHTNTAVMNGSFRYDLPSTTSVNNTISILNKKSIY
jgi:hypothetical protein